jgi:hypothetical protein
MTDHTEDSDAGRSDGRDAKGRYMKNHSGNPLGRPRKEKRAFTGSQQLADVLLTMEEETTLTVKGKRKKVPIIIVVYMQLMRLAAAGNIRCMFKAIDLRNQLLTTHDEERGSLAQTVVEMEKEYKRNPEEFTDEAIELLRGARELISDPYSIN